MFKVCPEGHGEFLAHVSECPDCGAELALATVSEPPVPASRPELPPAHELACVERGDPRALVESVGPLQAAGISCRIDPYPPDEPIRPGRRGSGVATTFGLYVLPADHDEARRILTERIQRTLPEAAGAAVEAGAELLACPACGTAIVDGARECAECGLAFPEAGTEA
jgi:hypothetical protein